MMNPFAMKPHVFQTTSILPRPIEEVFSFFSKAENLNSITPPELRFTILTPLPILIQQGTLIDYSIRLHGVPMRWKTLISAWEPPCRFVDEQLKGPYKVWVHEHTFKAIGDQTEMMDKVRFLSPGGIFEPLINRLFVEDKVKSIFEFRERKLKELF